ncbi:MAG: hypothetical protein L0Y37_07915 [Bacteroidales bacterium]|nr:hypothetical protein [Bacteroidales bacterium]
MDKVMLFVILSIPLIIISRRTLFDFRSHGFTRFFSWECINALFVLNYEQWFKDPFSATQVISWLLLSISLYLVTAGTVLLRKARKQDTVRADERLFRFERTTEMVTTGIYKYIRHPLYSSLLFLSWGIWFKQPGVTTVIIAIISSILLYLTSKADEDECVSFFGEKYSDYISRTKMFIPFIF